MQRALLVLLGGLTATSACSSTGGAEESGETSGTSGSSAALRDDFDEMPGANAYLGGLDAENWVEDQYITPHAGTQVFASGNGNASTTFPDLGITKELGGSIGAGPYGVSFFVAVDLENSMGVELSDFSELWIGGPAGTMEWVSTPQPTSEDVWVEWQGVYTPAAEEVGTPFRFHAVFDLDGEHSVSIDGPVTASELQQ